MVRPAKLKRRLALLAVLVVAGHVLGLEWMAREADQISRLPLMVAPMYTRLLQPTAPAPVVPVAKATVANPRPRAAPRPRPPASSAEELRRKREAQEQARREQEEEKERQEAQARAEADERARQEQQQVAQAAAPAAPAASAPQPGASEAQAAASAPQAAASAPQGAASAPALAASAAAAGDTAALDQWPVDTRLNYSLTGMYRGPLYGDARVQWQRAGGKYQVRLEAHIQVFGTQVLTSQGEVTPDGLVPRAYEELRPGKRRTAQIGDEVVILDNGRTVPRPPGVQDTASQFVELTQRFASGRETLEVGRSVTLWLARPGGVDKWVYDIVAREALQTPKFGVVEAYHLKPRQITNPRGNINVEMWFAPTLQYLPVKIRITMADEAWLDLLVDHIDQR